MIIDPLTGAAIIAVVLSLLVVVSRTRRSGIPTPRIRGRGRRISAPSSERSMLLAWIVLGSIVGAGAAIAGVDVPLLAIGERATTFGAIP